MGATSFLRQDTAHMRRALELAERGWGRVAPNPLVGAVVAHGPEIVGEGFHREYGQAHAEAAALTAAGERARAATLYVTLEPCGHRGKTPPCTEAIVRAGVRRVVFAAEDPNPSAAGGAAVLRQAGIEVAGGLERQAALDQNAPFFFAFSPAGADRPWVALKLALSLDARIADASGRSTWITGDAARAEVHRLRAGFDAVAVGIGTALVDDPRLTVRGELLPRRPPLRLVFDRLLRLPPTSYLARTAKELPVYVVCDPAAPPDSRRRLEKLGVRIVPVDTLAAGLRSLRADGVTSIICEGGAGLAAALLADGVVDRLFLFYAPLFLGKGGLQAFAEVPSASLASAPRWRPLRTERFGPDSLLTLAR